MYHEIDNTKTFVVSQFMGNGSTGVAQFVNVDLSSLEFTPDVMIVRSISFLDNGTSGVPCIVHIYCDFIRDALGSFIINNEANILTNVMSMNTFRLKNVNIYGFHNFYINDSINYVNENTIIIGLFSMVIEFVKYKHHS